MLAGGYNFYCNTEKAFEKGNRSEDEIRTNSCSMADKCHLCSCLEAMDRDGNIFSGKEIVEQWEREGS